jgi:two-component system sensor histidine kinase MprB
VTLAAGFAVLLAVVAVSIAVYLVERGNLRAQIDESLSHYATGTPSVEPHDQHLGSGKQPKPPGDVFEQVVDRDGRMVTALSDRRMPVTDEVLAVARGERGQIFFDVDVDVTPVRVRVIPAGDGKALQVGRSLVEVEAALRRLVWALVAISGVAVVVAGVIGRIVAASAVAPVRRVAEAADTVARTKDLSHHIAAPGGDELGRLAASFNTMLDALSDAVSQQRQLVADASHELRTPLATVRTNVEVLARADEMDPGEKATLIGDTVVQLGELTRLVSDLVELARGDGQQEPLTLVDLDDLVRRVVVAAGRNHPSIRLRLDSRPSLVRGAAQRVERAVSNLIDNAAKWSPPGAEVEIGVRDGTVTVRDHGPGVAPADLPRIFDRFYRSPDARTMPGSGLGLAIVKQVADSHGGTVTAQTAPGGGALLILRFPAIAGAPERASAPQPEVADAPE